MAKQIINNLVSKVTGELARTFGAGDSIASIRNFNDASWPLAIRIAVNISYWAAYNMTNHKWYARIVIRKADSTFNIYVYNHGVLSYCKINLTAYELRKFGEQPLWAPLVSAAIVNNSLKTFRRPALSQ